MRDHFAQNLLSTGAQGDISWLVLAIVAVKGPFAVIEDVYQSSVGTADRVEILVQEN